ncbi:MAG: hypothetical protein QOG11_957, partial [Solirubrobacteraceae bacterium]|nr:hypothetical protein [Solirubrobacteraceae bacterium]
MLTTAATSVRLDVNAVDYAI